MSSAKDTAIKINPLAGKPVDHSALVYAPKLVTSYYPEMPDPSVPAQKEMLERLSTQQVRFADLAGEKIQTNLTHAAGNGVPIGGLKVITESGWFAARPSGTENIYKIYAESFREADHLPRIIEEAQAIVSEALAGGTR
jgi:phosphoglucomutase